MTTKEHVYKLFEVHNKNIEKSINNLKSKISEFEDFTGIPDIMYRSVDNIIRNSFKNGKNNNSNPEYIKQLREHIDYLKQPKISDLKYDEGNKKIILTDNETQQNLELVDKVNEQLNKYENLKISHNRIKNEFDTLYNELEEANIEKDELSSKLDETKSDLENLLNEDSIKIKQDSSSNKLISIEYTGNNQNIKKSIDLINNEINGFYNLIEDIKSEHEKSLDNEINKRQELEEMLYSNQDKNISNAQLRAQDSLNYIDEDTKSFIDEAIRSSNPTLILDYISDLNESAKNHVNEAIFKEKLVSEEKTYKINELENILKTKDEELKEEKRINKNYKLEMNRLQDIEEKDKQNQIYIETLENKIVISHKAKTQSRENAKALQFKVNHLENLYEQAENKGNKVFTLYKRAINSIKRLVTKRENLEKKTYLLNEENNLKDLKIQRMVGPFERAVKTAGELETMKSDVKKLQLEYNSALANLNNAQKMLEQKDDDVLRFKNQYQKQLHKTELKEIEAKKANEEKIKLEKQNRIHKAQLKVIAAQIDDEKPLMLKACDDDKQKTYELELVKI
ncbi:MAG: hypothetical protein ACOC3X_00575 [Nanoarchaeota archaeon]